MNNTAVSSDYDVEDMEFLVEFEIKIPVGTTESEVKDREDAEAEAAAKLVQEGHLVRQRDRSWTACCARCRCTSGCASASHRLPLIRTIQRDRR